jgi:SRSO17 transposase
VDLIWRRGSKGLQRGRFLALRVRPAGVIPRRLARQAGGELQVRWLLVEWPQSKPEPTKYWLSNLPEATPLVELVGLARSRWRVEQDYRELKGGLGLDHFEGRGWAGLRRSLVMSVHAWLFGLPVVLADSNTKLGVARELPRRRAAGLGWMRPGLVPSWRGADGVAVVLR